MNTKSKIISPSFIANMNILSTFLTASFTPHRCVILSYARYPNIEVVCGLMKQPFFLVLLLFATYENAYKISNIFVD